MFAFQGLIALIQFILFKTTYKLDTPTSLIDRGFEGKAMRSLLEVYNEAGASKFMSSSGAESIPLNSSTNLPNILKRNEEGFTELLCCKNNNFKMMRLGIMACIIQEFCGIIPVLAYATTIFSSFGGGEFIARLLTFVSGVVKTLCVMSVLPYVDKWGRRPLYIFGSIFMGIFMLLLGIFSGITNVIYIIPFLCVEGYLIAYEASLGPVCWIYCGEVMSPKGMSIAISIN